MKYLKIKKFFLGFAISSTLGILAVSTIQPIAAYAAEESSNNNVTEQITVAENAVEELAENSITADPTEVQPRAHVSYYPSSGVSSGVFYGASSGNAPVYNNLPAHKTLYFSYSVSGGGTCYLRFYPGSGVGGSSYWSAALSADDTAHESSITLPSAGTYTVQVYMPNATSGSEHIYAFTLYTK